MTTHAHRSLNLQQIFTWLMADGIVKKEDAKIQFHATQGILKNGIANMHPLTAIAQAKIHSAMTPHILLTLDWMTEYVAGKVKLPFYRIDPLKIDFTTVSDVMSASYATRFNILPVELAGNTIVVATTDPYNTEWLDEITKISRKEIRMVFANPLDISQYIVQFFSLAKSIKDARKSSSNDIALRQNFEQLVELGKANKQVDANDQHIINIVDWLWQFAFD